MPKCRQHSGKPDKRVPGPGVFVLAGKIGIVHADAGNLDTERLKTAKPGNVMRVSYGLLPMRCLERAEPRLPGGNSLVPFRGKRTPGSGPKKCKGPEASKFCRYSKLVSDVGE